MDIKKIVLFFLVCHLNIEVLSSPANKYISATVAVSANGFISLQKAFDEIQSELVGAKLQTTPINMQAYHMTLVGFDLVLNPKINNAQQTMILKIVDSALSRAANIILKKYLESTSIILKFAYIGIFSKKVVAVFEATQRLQNLINKIESEFKKNIQYLIDNKNIIKVTKHQQILQPHVSLAKIINTNPHFGAGIAPITKVKDFYISKPMALISVQLRNSAASNHRFNLIRSKL